MPDFFSQVDERVRAFGGDWGKYSVVGSFVLYLTGYLVLRFHLTALGVATDLAVLDERYLFAGARFAVYAAMTLPSIVLLALPVLALVWLFRRVVARDPRRAGRPSLDTPGRLVAVGILFSVIVVQFVMRQCFYFSDLLLAPGMPAEAPWLRALLLDDRLMPLYFSALVFATLLTGAIWWKSMQAVEPGASLRAGRGLLAVLAVIQCLLLPVNYGILVADKSLPRVAGIGATPLEAGERAWLVWEGKDGSTFLVSRGPDRQRTLLTLPHAQVQRVEIVGFDAILPTLFGPSSSAAK